MFTKSKGKEKTSKGSKAELYATLDNNTLTKLELKGESSESLTEIFARAENNTSIRQIKITQCHVSNNNFQILVAGLINKPNLKEFVFSGNIACYNEDIDSKDWIDLDEDVKDWIELDEHYDHRIDRSFIGFIATIKQLPLKTLEIGSDAILGSELFLLFNALRDNTTIQRLVLSCKSLHLDDRKQFLFALRKLIENNKILKQLVIKAEGFNEDDHLNALIAISEAINKNTALVQIELQYETISTFAVVYEDDSKSEIEKRDLEEQARLKKTQNQTKQAIQTTLDKNKLLEKQHDLLVHIESGKVEENKEKRKEIQLDLQDNFEKYLTLSQKVDEESVMKLANTYRDHGLPHLAYSILENIPKHSDYYSEACTRRAQELYVTPLQYTTAKTNRERLRDVVRLLLDSGDNQGLLDIVYTQLCNENESAKIFDKALVAENVSTDTETLLKLADHIQQLKIRLNKPTIPESAASTSSASGKKAHPVAKLNIHSETTKKQHGKYKKRKTHHYQHHK